MEPRSQYREEYRETTEEGDGRPIGLLFRELGDETRHLFQQEVSLAKAELSEKAKRLGRNAAYLAAGGFVAYAGALVLLFALGALAGIGLEAAGLGEGIASWLGPAIVGLVVALIGYGLIQKALTTLRRESLAPRKTIETLKEDKEWTQRKISQT